MRIFFCGIGKTGLVAVRMGVGMGGAACGGEAESGVSDASKRLEFSAKDSQCAGRSAKDEDLEAELGVEVDVECADDHSDVLVLYLCEFGFETPGVMIVDHGECSSHFVWGFLAFAQEALLDEVGDGL